LAAPARVGKKKGRLRPPLRSPPDRNSQFSSGPIPSRSIMERKLNLLYALDVQQAPVIHLSSKLFRTLCPAGNSGEAGQHAVNLRRSQT
jgi:hypothetical protein